jgi:hypothetical protein
MPVLRFQKQASITTEQLTKLLPAGTFNSISVPSPGEFLDIDVTAGGTTDCEDVLLEQGYSLFAVNPVPPLQETAAAAVPPVTSIRESGGADLSIGAISSGQLVFRSGTSVLGETAIDDTQHGTRSGGTLHALVVAAGTAGFISGSDKSKLDGIAIGATNTPLASTAPEDVTKTAAVVGVGTTAARADHKHDISTGVPVAVGSANAEGSAISLSRSDHVHAPRSGSVIQRVFYEQTTDTSTASTTFVTFVSQSITTSANSRLLIHFDFSGRNTNNNPEIRFRISIDSTPIRATAQSLRATESSSGALTVFPSTAFSAGAHTVLVEWSTSANTASINPVTRSSTDHASLLIEEISA